MEKMLARGRWLLFLFLFMVLVVVPVPPMVLAGEVGKVVDLVLLPAAPTANVGDKFTIAIEARGNGQDITGIQACIDFDATKLAVQSVTPGATLNMLLINRFDNGAGTIDYAAGTTTTPWPSGTFTVATISVTALAPIAGTPIGFHTAGVVRKTDVDMGGASKLRNAVGATVAIAGTPQPVPSPTPQPAPPPTPRPSPLPTPQPAPPPTPQPAPPPVPQPGMGNLSRIISDKGVLNSVAALKSQDESAKLTINAGTAVLTRDKKPVSDITINRLQTAPALPPGAYSVSDIYDFGPDGATFNPPARLQLSYCDCRVPEAVVEKDLVIAWWDATSSKWVELVSQVLPDANVVSANVPHFTAFTILGYKAVAKPTAFTIASFSISPAEVNAGEKVTISFVVNNTGGDTGSYKSALKLNDALEATEHTQVRAGGSEKVSFVVAKEAAGTYRVDVNGVTGSFKVRAKTAAAPGAPAPPTPLPSSSEAEPFNWLVLGGVLGGALVCGLIILLVRMRSY